MWQTLQYFFKSILLSGKLIVDTLMLKGSQAMVEAIRALIGNKALTYVN